MVRKKRPYKVEGYSSWYIVMAYNKSDAHRDGVLELGVGGVKSITRATDNDIELYKSLRDTIEETESVS